ncbi:hypothetical protein V6N11_047832 [Hibiscus sabdariffa]|uniref:Uncharacterized protein n=1 Tax=Hibiscus sabdariffa TaxID=183260 RepID=A0ABR2P847_9ROSI
MYYARLVGSTTRDFADLVTTGEAIKRAIKSERLISPIFLTPLQPPYPAWYDPSAHCEYHAGIPGHSIKNCIAFKRRVQHLINHNVIQLNTSQGPNVANNPLPAYDEPRVNTVINDGGIKIKTSISEVSSPLKWVWEMMIERGLVSYRPKVAFNHNEVFCEFHGEIGHEIQKCDEFRRFVQDLMDNNEVEFFEQSHEIRDVFVLEELLSKMSYGVGRPFMINVPQKKEGVPEKPPSRLVIEASSPFPYKNSRRVPWIYGCNMIAPKREVSETEVAGISGVGNFTQSGRCRPLDASKPMELKMLSKKISFHWMEEYQKSMKHEDEIPPKGTSSVKALHIITHFHGHILPHVLVDNGISFELRAFDGTRREVAGKIDVPLLIGPATYNVEFVVMDITPAYNYLLGRPWIHAAGAVPSTLHQKVKFVIDGRLVSVGAEEDIIASASTDALYIDVDEKAIECTFRSLEFVNATFVAERKKIPKPRLLKNTMMGPILKYDRSGVGYKPNPRQKMKKILKMREQRRARLIGQSIEGEPMQFPQISETFVSGGHIHFEGGKKETSVMSLEMIHEMSINAVGEDVEMSRNRLEIRPCPPGSSDINYTNDTATSSRVDFERDICSGECESDDDYEDYELTPDLLRLIEQENKEILPHQESIETINLGTDDELREVKIGTLISLSTKDRLVSLLQEFKDVFAWTYEDMPGLDTSIVTHKLPLKLECKPMQQKLRRMRPEMLLQIRDEVRKQFDAGFLQVAKYSEWVANVVPVPKKKGKVRMCVDYRDLNHASPKDNFPLPHIDTLVDNTAKHCLFSFMDSFMTM